MSEIKIPTPGRVVHYFHNGNDEVTAKNNVEFVPAIVVQSFGSLLANIQVFTMNGDAPNVLRYSVRHKSEAGESGTYWEYPEIK